MTTGVVDETIPLEGLERILGEVRGSRPGPTVIYIAGMHGNEAAGVKALLRVLPVLEKRRADLAGDVVAILGNRAALDAGRRFVDRDLNRAWTAERIDRIHDGSWDEGLVEDREQVELLEAIEGAISAARGTVHVIDFHTTSGTGGPFTTVSDTLANRDFALSVPIPLLVGLEELVEGTLLSYLNELGYISVGFESGQHDEPSSVDCAEAGIWITAEAAGLFNGARVPEADRGRTELGGLFSELPRVLEMRHRHGVKVEDRFDMKPGYSNFQELRAGEVLARDRHGLVTAPSSGRMLMPLYQEQGEDGFFIVREFRPFWLAVSSILRRTRIDRLAHWFPGVSKEPSVSGALVANRRVARWYALELFHLFGYRKHLEEGDRIVVVRRKQTPRQPDSG